jgi:hypothetical protein
MRHSASDYCQVISVADELVACGLVNPQARHICEGLRARGFRYSALSVYKHLLRWRSQWARLTAPSAELVKSDPSESQRGVVRITVRSLVALQQEIAELKRQAGDLADADEARHDQIDDLRRQIQALRGERDYLSGRCSVLTETNERLRYEADYEREEAVRARIELARNRFLETHYPQQQPVRRQEPRAGIPISFVTPA